MKKSLFWAIVLDILLFIGLIIYIASPSGVVTPESLTMTPAAAAVTRGAISLVVNDIQNGKITSYDMAILALKSEIPQNVQAQVLAQLEDSTFATISDDMVALAGRIKVVE